MSNPAEMAAKHMADTLHFVGKALHPAPEPEACDTLADCNGRAAEVAASVTPNPSTWAAPDNGGWIAKVLEAADQLPPVPDMDASYARKTLDATERMLCDALREKGYAQIRLADNVETCHHVLELLGSYRCESPQLSTPLAQALDILGGIIWGKTTDSYRRRLVNLEAACRASEWTESQIAEGEGGRDA